MCTPAHNSSSAAEDRLYPVMVYIHGGGYEVGTPVVSPGDVIPLWGVVLVTIQYGLGPLVLLQREIRWLQEIMEC